MYMSPHIYIYIRIYIHIHVHMLDTDTDFYSCYIYICGYHHIIIYHVMGNIGSHMCSRYLYTFVCRYVGHSPRKFQHNPGADAVTMSS